MSTPEPKKPFEKTHRLTLSESRGSLVLPLCIGLTLLALGMAALVGKQVAGAGVFGSVALMQFVMLPALLKRHRQIKQGLAVYVAVNTHPMHIPQIVSVVVVFMVTTFVSICSVFIVYVALKYFNTHIGWTVCGVTLLAVWLFVSYCWYRIATEKPPVVPVVAQEQPEGVWPPAPLTVQESKKDMETR